MASHMTISKGQTEALKQFLDKHLPEDINKAVEEFGQETAFRLYKLNERLAAKVK